MFRPVSFQLTPFPSAIDESETAKMLGACWWVLLYLSISLQTWKKGADDGSILPYHVVSQWQSSNFMYDSIWRILVWASIKRNPSCMAFCYTDFDWSMQWSPPKQPPITPSFKHIIPINTPSTNIQLEAVSIGGPSTAWHWRLLQHMTWAVGLRLARAWLMTWRNKSMISPR